MSNVTLYIGDCLKEMRKIADKSVDLILCDLPYGTTSCKWDNIIPFDDLWKEYKRIITDTGVIALFGDGSLFTAKLMLSNERWFKYNWYWKRSLASNFFSCKKQPRFRIETISIFYNKQPIYNPQIEEGKPYKGRNDTNKINTSQTTVNSKRIGGENTGTRYPSNIIEFSNPNQNRLHPTQKPVPLLEYLIKTYTTEGMVVLDNTMGSGSTGVAAKNVNRDFIGIEMDENYYKIAAGRINGIK